MWNPRNFGARQRSIFPSRLCDPGSSSQRTAALAGLLLCSFAAALSILAICDLFTTSHSSWRIVCIFGFALLICCAGVWAIQRYRMLSALALARLQMEFVASMSHELRAPLAVLSSAADNLADGLIADESLPAYGAVLQKQSRRIGELIEQILLFATEDKDVHRYVPQPLELAPILDAVLVEAEAQARAAGISIERDIGAGLPLVVGSAAGIARCIQSLLGNAIKYSGSGQQVSVRACRAAVEHRDWEEVRIVIEDCGMGIGSDELEHVFEPFYRSPRAQTARIPGDGLGLSLASSIAKSMGAALSAQSKLSNGSTFTLHLQIAKMDNK